MMDCKYCGKQIKWIETTGGKKMPCDIKLIPYWEAKLGPAKIVTPDGKVVSCFLEGDSAQTTGFGYAPHWGTCSGIPKVKAKAARKDKLNLIKIEKINLFE